MAKGSKTNAQPINIMTRIFSFYNFTHALEIGFIHTIFFFSSLFHVVMLLNNEMKLCAGCFCDSIAQTVFKYYRF